MKTTLVLMSLCAITALLVEIIRLHSSEFTKWAVFYLTAQFLFMFVCWKTGTLKGWNSLAYMRAFTWTMSLLCTTAVALSVKFAGSIPRTQARMALIEICGVFVVVVCGLFIFAMSEANMASRFAVGHIINAGILLFCGVLSLCSMAFPSDIVGELLKIFLGAYWAAQGAYGLAEPGMFLRGRSLAVARLSFIPILISAIIFTSLAIILRSYQREASRQSFVADIIETIR